MSLHNVERYIREYYHQVLLYCMAISICKDMSFIGKISYNSARPSQSIGSVRAPTVTEPYNVRCKLYLEIGSVKNVHKKHC